VCGVGKFPFGGLGFIHRPIWPTQQVQQGAAATAGISLLLCCSPWYYCSPPGVLPAVFVHFGCRLSPVLVLFFVCCCLQLTAPSQLGRRSDMDPNGHINNVAYLAWAMEVIPDHVYQQYQLSEVGAAHVWLLQAPQSGVCLIHPYAAGSCQLTFHKLGIFMSLHTVD
jgi:hypothetical protein